MNKTSDIVEPFSKFLTNERFEFGLSEVKKRLTQLKNEGQIDESQFEKIQNEDFLLKVKYKTYKKCLKQIIIALILTATGLGLIRVSSLGYIFILPGILLAYSAFFGILSNRLTKNQKEYLKK